jgi:hypothetical protein
MFTINGKDMADLLRALHIARIDANAYMDAEEAEDLCLDHLMELGSEAAHSAAILCSTVQYLLFDKNNWKG